MGIINRPCCTLKSAELFTRRLRLATERKQQPKKGRWWKLSHLSAWMHHPFFKINSTKTRKQRNRPAVTECVRKKYIDWHVLKLLFTCSNRLAVSLLKPRLLWICMQKSYQTHFTNCHIGDGERDAARKPFLQPLQKLLELSCKVSFCHICLFNMIGNLAFTSPYHWKLQTISSCKEPVATSSCEWQSSCVRVRVREEGGLLCRAIFVSAQWCSHEQAAGQNCGAGADPVAMDGPSKEGCARECACMRHVAKEQNRSERRLEEKGHCFHFTKSENNS